MRWKNACGKGFLPTPVDVYGREAVHTLVADMAPRVTAGDFG